MLDLTAAAEQILAPLVPVGSEEVSLADSSGRVLAADVSSDVSLPPWDNSAMDGYAVRADDVRDANSDNPAKLRVIGTVAAGQRSTLTLGAGEAMRIMTGAPIPVGADSVIRVEDTDRGATIVSINSARDAGRNVRPGGEDVAAGSIVAERGTVVTAALLALLAGVGCARPRVARRPVVALVSSGNELTSIDGFADVRRGERIVATNGYVLSAIVREAGGEVLDLGVAPDDRARIRAMVADAASRADLVVTTAGVSVGEHDHTKSVVEELGRIAFWRISARPGSQLAFGAVAGTPWLGLPGNPVSAAITGELFVRPVVLRLQGVRAVHRAPVTVRLGTAIDGTPGTTLLLRARLTPYNGGFIAELTGPQGSGLMSSMARANALLIIPAGAQSLPAGAMVAAIPLHGAVAMDTVLRVRATDTA